MVTMRRMDIVKVAIEVACVRKKPWKKYTNVAKKMVMKQQWKKWRKNTN
jgi:hypothetical protein